MLGAGSLGLGTAAEEIAKNIGLLSDGTLTVRLYAAGELVAAEEAFDSVTSGGAMAARAALVLADRPLPAPQQVEEVIQGLCPAY